MAIDPRNGEIVWDVPGQYHCPDAGDASGDPLPVANGLVFAVLGCAGPSGVTEVCAFKATSGATAWCDESPAYIEAMIADKGLLFLEQASSSKGPIVALNATTGAKQWSTTISGWNYGTLAAANGSLFIEDGRADLDALSESNGKLLWTYNANGNAFQGNALSVANGVVYADGGGGNNGNFAIDAFSAKTGALLWQSTSVGNGAAPMSPIILNGKIYAGCYTLCEFTLGTKRSFGLR